MAKFWRKLKRRANRAVKTIERTANKSADTIEQKANQTSNKIEKLANQSVNAVSILANKLINGANTFSPSAKEILNKYGDKQIVKLEIIRNPIPAPVQGILDNFGGRIGIDRLMHLALLWTLDDGTRGILEKNEVINIQRGTLAVENGGEKLMINESPNTTLNELMTATKSRMGSKMFSYSVTNNCQQFLKNVLEAGGLMTPEYMKFIVQDTDNLFKGKGNLRKFANTVTDVAGRFNMLTQGGALENGGIICGGRLRKTTSLVRYK